MAHVGQELRLVLAGDLELATLFLQLPKQTRILDGQGRLRREGLNDFDHLWCKDTWRLTADSETAKHPPFAYERDAQQSAKAGSLDRLADTAGVRIIRSYIRNLHWCSRRGRSPKDALVQQKGPRSNLFDKLWRKTLACTGPELARGFVELVDDAFVGCRELHCSRDDRVQHLLQLQRRVDGLSHLRERAQLLDRPTKFGGACLQLIEEPSVLDRNHRLIGEGLQHGDLAV